MIVPNDSDSLLTTESKGHLDFLPAITSKGYKLIIKQPKYLDPNIQRCGVTPTYHYLFELAS